MALPKPQSNSNLQSNNQSADNQHQVLMQHFKRQLHQNNLQLYCSQNQNNQTLLDVIADYLSISKQQLHKLISNKFKQMFSQQTLPKKLSYIYSDPQIVKEYQKDPELVSFYKITYELVCVIYEVKIIIYTLLRKSDNQFILNAMIVNTKGYERQIQLARMGNFFYRVQQQFHQAQQFSLPSLQSLNSAKSSNNLNSQQKQQKQFKKMKEPFKSQKIIVDPQVIKQKSQRLSPNNKSSSDNYRQEQQNIMSLKLKKGKSVNFMHTDHIKNETEMSQYDDNISLGNIIDREQQKQLLKNCSNFGKQSNTSSKRLQLIHQNNHIQSNIVHPSDIMYYYYMSQHQGNYNNHAYPGKSQPYLPYSNPPMSPTKNPNKPIGGNTNNSPVKSNQPFSPIYTTQQQPTHDPVVTTAQTSSSHTNTATTSHSHHPPVQIKQGERYLGRLKFFDEGKNYGFIIMDADQSDLFVHFDDIQKAGISKQKLKTFKQIEGYMQVRFSFKVMEYFGKYRQSRKAVDLIVLEQP